MRLQFADQVEFKANEKTAVSVRDGVIWYLGSELGLEPADKEFSVYRSPATIANAAGALPNIPVTIDHVSLDAEPPTTGSMVLDSSVIDLIDEDTSTRLAVRNKLDMSDDAMSLLADKHQLSLGYHASLVEHPEFDFEQQDIQPHHLAIVEAGRCGALCSFLDRKGTGMKKNFVDKTPQLTLQQVSELAEAVMEGIKNTPMDKLMAALPTLQQIAAAATVPASGEELMNEGEMDAEAVEAPAVDDEPEAAAPAPAVVAVEDEEMEGASPSFSDADLNARVKAAIAEHGKVMDKARQFLDSDYSFEGKTTKRIMRDAIATEHTESFTDAELPTVFKMLKKSETYKNFGDSQVVNRLDEIGKKERG